MSEIDINCVQNIFTYLLRDSKALYKPDKSPNNNKF